MLCLLCICLFQNWKTRIVCSTYLDMLLEAFPIMCKFALDKNLLLLGLQRRIIELSFKVAASKIARDGKKTPSEFTKNQSACNIFGVLRAYLATFEQLLTTSFAGMDSKLTDQYLGLQSILESTLDLLLLVREVGRKTSSIATILNIFMTMHRLCTKILHWQCFPIVPGNPYLIFRPSEALLESKVNACGLVSLSFSVCTRRFCSLITVFCLKHAVLSS